MISIKSIKYLLKYNKCITTSLANVVKILFGHQNVNNNRDNNRGRTLKTSRPM